MSKTHRPARSACERGRAVPLSPARCSRVAGRGPRNRPHPLQIRQAVKSRQRDMFDPTKLERKWQAFWAANGTNEPDLDGAPNPYYNLMMFPYPSAEGLHVGNVFAFTGADFHAPVPASAGPGRVRADRVRRVRHPLGELRAQGRHAPDGADPEEHRQLHAPAEAHRGSCSTGRTRSTPRIRSTTAGRSGSSCSSIEAGLAGQEGGAGQLVPVLQDRAGQRAGDRRQVRALRHGGRDSGSSSQWFFRITEYAERLLDEPGLDRLVSVHADRPAKLDRPLGRRPSPLPAGRRSKRHAGGVHDPA